MQVRTYRDPAQRSNPRLCDGRFAASSSALTCTCARCKCRLRHEKSAHPSTHIVPMSFGSAGGISGIISARDWSCRAVEEAAGMETCVVRSYCRRYL